MVSPQPPNSIMRTSALVRPPVRLVIDTHRTSIRGTAVKGQKVVLTDFGWSYAVPTTSASGTGASFPRLALTRAEPDAASSAPALVTHVPYPPARRSAPTATPLHQASPGTDGPATASDDLLAELERRNQLRVAAHWQCVESRSLSSAELEKRLGVTPQRLEQLRAERKVIGLHLPQRREVYYPLWQFAEDGRPLPVLPRLLDAAAEAHIDPLALDALMTSEAAGDGISPAGLLHRHQDDSVLALVRAAFAHGA